MKTFVFTILAAFVAGLSSGMLSFVKADEDAAVSVEELAEKPAPMVVVDIECVRAKLHYNSRGKVDHYGRKTAEPFRRTDMDEFIGRLLECRAKAATFGHYQSTLVRVASLESVSRWHGDEKDRLESNVDEHSTLIDTLRQQIKTLEERIEALETGK